MPGLQIKSELKKDLQIPLAEEIRPLPNLTRQTTQSHNHFKKHPGLNELKLKNYWINSGSLSKDYSKGSKPTGSHSFLRFQKQNRYRTDIPCLECVLWSHIEFGFIRRKIWDASQTVFFPRSITPMTQAIKGPWLYTKCQLRHPILPDVTADLKPTRQVHQ